MSWLTSVNSLNFLLFVSFLLSPVRRSRHTSTSPSLFHTNGRSRRCVGICQSSSVGGGTCPNYHLWLADTSSICSDDSNVIHIIIIHGILTPHYIFEPLFCHWVTFVFILLMCDFIQLKIQWPSLTEMWVQPVEICIWSEHSLIAFN